MKPVSNFLLLSTFLLFACSQEQKPTILINPSLNNIATEVDGEYITVSRAAYQDKLYGFWLGQSIANWTGLITEMDKIGNVGEIKTGDFYTRDNWGKPDQPSIWAEGIPSDLSPTIDFIFADKDSIWGSDDDTDIEYIYQELLLTHNTSILTPEQIRDGWLKHMMAEEENYLWVSNQKAFDLMREGILPPATSDPSNNEHYAMIDAQLTTEIFGFYAPSRNDISLNMSELPIRTSAALEAEEIAQFYVSLYNAFALPFDGPVSEHIFKSAQKIRDNMNQEAYPAKMFDFVKRQYEEEKTWEEARDAIYQRYQVEQADGYDITSQNLYCNGCFAAGINYAASLVSLFYGEGDFKETVKIAVLSGWDSDNPAATWGGLLGFYLGKNGLEKAFDRTFSNQFNIHRTRQGFPNNGIDTFEQMSTKGLWVIDRVVVEEMNGAIDAKGEFWYIPTKN